MPMGSFNMPNKKWLVPGAYICTNYRKYFKFQFSKVNWGAEFPSLPSFWLTVARFTNSFVKLKIMSSSC